MKDHSRKLAIAPRKFKRMLSEGVSNSICKTVTEPVTNSWDSYKRLKQLDDSSGIVGEFLGREVGSKVDHQDLVKSIRPTKGLSEIRIRVATTKKHDMTKDQCQIIDQAEGLTEKELDATFAEYGADKSKQSQGAAVRGLFGQGVSDVLWGHAKGKIVSIKNGSMSRLTAEYDTNDTPVYTVEGLGQPTKSIRRDIGIRENGTCIDFTVAEKCRIPDRDPLYYKLCNFYMLRLINANPCCNVILEQQRSDGVHSERLRYNIPTGQVIHKFKTQVTYLHYPPVQVDAVVARAVEPLNSDASLDTRESGLLVVDEHDAVYDLTLFDFDRLPGLERLYGVVRLTGFREIARDRLQNFNEAIITDTRDGLQQRHDFTRALYAALKPHLEGVVREEKKRILEGDTDLSKEVKDRVDKAMTTLNSLFAAETGEHGEGPGEDGFKVPEFDCVTFEPQEISLRAGVPRSVYLLAKSSAVRRKSSIIAESKNPDIVIEPDDTNFETAKEVAPGILALRFRVNSTIIGASGSIEALIEGASKGDSHTAELNVLDVQVPPELSLPDDGMEFRPSLASASPHRKGLVVLYVDTNKIPVGSQISLRVEDASGSIAFITDQGTEVFSFIHLLAKQDVLPKMKLAKIPVHFRGHGKGQHAIISGKTKVKGGSKFTAEAEVRIKDPIAADEGMFKKIEYGPIPGKKLACQFDPTDGTIWINSKHPTNIGFFSDTKRSFNDSVMADRGAQIRLAELILDEAMYHTLARKQGLTGEKGWSPGSDPVGSIRTQIEEWKHDIGTKLFRAIVSDFKVPKEFIID